MIKTCEHCGKEFVITNGEYHFFELKGYKLPKYCKCCRDKKKLEAYQFECRKCGKLFILDGLEFEKLKKKFGEKFKEPCTCSECKHATVGTSSSSS
jgi:hypothetical protein